MQTKQNKLVAVAAVRGDEASDPTPLYWKGGRSEGPVKQNEVDEFNAALDLAIQGNKEDAEQKLKQFASQYPESPLLPEVNQTLVQLSSSENKGADGQ